MNEFKGKTAVVTGGASGIGKAIAARCCAEGMNVVLADIEAGQLEIARQELAGTGQRVIGVLTDVSQAGAIDRLARETVAAFGSVDLLVNNAGVGAGSTAWESTLEDWTWVMGVNLWSVIHGIRTFVPIMLKQGTPAHIVNTASIAGLLKGHHSATYATTKHAVVALSEQLSLEFERTGAPIGVSVLCPGWVNTRINECARNRPAHLRNQDEHQPPDPSTPEGRKRLEELRKAMQGAPPASTMADPVFEAIRKGKLYIIPHEQFVENIRNRFDGILKDV